MTESEEELREAVLDLERARQAERKLRVQNEGLLQGLEVLGSTDDNQEMFERLLELLRDLLGFQEAFVLTSSPGSPLRTVATTSPAFEEIDWEIGELTERVLEDDPIATFNTRLIPEWRPLLDRPDIDATSALHIGLRGGANASLLVCTHPEAGRFSHEHVELGRRLSMLAAQALVNRDLRELKLKAFERSVRDQFFSVSRDLMAILDFDGAFQQLNPAFEDQLGHRPARLKGEQLADLAIPEDRDGVEERLDELFDRQEAVSFQARFRSGEGEARWLHWNMSASGDEELVYAAARDVTEQRESRRRLEQLNDQLRQARDQALAANKAKSTFLANMSHELRTPLNAILGYSEMLIADLSGVDDNRYVDDLERVRAAGNRLLSLIEDVLDLNKVEAGRMQLNLTTFRLADLIEDLRRTVDPLMAKNDNVLTVPEEADLGRMTTDRGKLRQVLFNLMSNAAKFTGDGEVELQAFEDSTPAREEIVLEVSDTGIGMSAEELDEVFEAFSQADNSTTREFEGSGLGLTITQHFCRLLGGRLEVDSTPGEGTTVTVRLPRSWATGGDDEQPADQEAVSAGQDDEARQILVIDDNVDDRDLLRRSFERAGYEVAVASNGSEGLHLAEELEPDLITLDIIMPMMDGWTVCRRIKESETVGEVPVVLITMVDDRERGRTMGADAYLSKPVDRQEAVDRIGALLEES